MKVLLQTNIPAPYRVDFFNELGKYCELTVIFEGKRSSWGRVFNWKEDDALNFKAIYLNEVCQYKLSIKMIRMFLSNDFDIRCILYYPSKSAILTLLLTRLLGIKCGIEMDGAFINKGENKMKKLWKSIIIDSASYYLSPCYGTDEFFRYYSFKSPELFRYSFTSSFKKHALDSCLTLSEKREIRDKLNIPYSKVVLSIGRFIPGKGIDVLLKAIDNSNDIGIYIISGKPTEEYESIVSERNLKNVHFVDFMDSKELEKYYKAADLFVLPTRRDVWGLVINEAMLYGLPVITTNMCNAGLALLDNQDKTIVPIDDVEKLHNSIYELINDNSLAQQIGNRNLNHIKNHCIEDMAKEHIDYFEKLVRKEA